MEDDLAKDFVALWRSEMAAMAADRELRESLVGMATLWATSANTMFDMLRSFAREPAGGARAAQPPRPAPPAVAFEPGVAEVERLNRRIAELEQRMAERNDSVAEPGRLAQGAGQRDGD